MLFSATSPNRGQSELNESGSLLWTPAQGASGLLVVAQPRPLAAVVGGRIVEIPIGGADDSEGSHTIRGRLSQVTLGGLVIVSNSRQKEPSRIIGHPDLASGASVQRGETLYVSVAEAIYRESRGESVEVHLSPTAEDNEALADLRARARHRWDSDRLPDGWTRPLPRSHATPCPNKDESIGAMPEDLRALAERLRSKEQPVTE